MPGRADAVPDVVDPVPGGEHAVPRAGHILSARRDEVPPRVVEVRDHTDPVPGLPKGADIRGDRDAVPDAGCNLSHACGGEAVNRFA